MNMWRRLFVSLAVALGLFAAVAGEAMAQEPPALGRLAAANQRHERGEFTEAVQHYEAVIGMGYRDPVVYYNLGNAYLESGDLGRAILNYLRAEELSPRDPDIFANLAVARSRTVDQLEAEGDTLVASVANFGGRWATTAEFAVAALLLWAVAGIIVVALILRPAMRLGAVLRGGAVAAVVVMLVPLVPLVPLLSMLYSDPYDNTGVVTAGTVEVLSGPGTQYSEEFALHSGAQVRLVDSRHGWLQVALPGGELQGWLPAHAVEAVGRDGG